MRMTINIDDARQIKLTNLVGPLNHSAVVNEGQKALIQREVARRLARLSGTQPGLKVGSRRRSASKP